jgi:hypothetical protein
MILVCTNFSHVNPTIRITIFDFIHVRRYNNILYFLRHNGHFDLNRTRTLGLYYQLKEANVTSLAIDEKYLSHNHIIS